jgi:thiamine-phosphate pyrophosphorylase
MIDIPEIQYITRDNNIYSHAEQARLMFKNGINWVQIRMKNAAMTDMLEQARKAMHYANKYKGKLIINDSLEITRKVKAHGIHLGLHDTPIDKARELLGHNIIIGGTANSIEDIIMQFSKGADYIGLGPFRFTSTKKNLSPIIGLEGYRKIKEQMLAQRISVPVVAVGGILETDITEIKETGMNGVAISEALFNKIIKNS